MDDGVTKEKVRNLLNGMGFKVKDIPKREDRRTPDFEVSGKNEVYIFELKEKGDDPKGVGREHEKLAAGEIVTKAVPVGYRNQLDAIIESGVEQMSLENPDHDKLHVLWLECKGEDPSHHWKRFHATLYGVETLMSKELPNVVTAYFFKNSSFYRWKDQLDGTILSREEIGQLCVNPLSSMYNDMMKSELYARLKDGICDPKIEEKKNQAFITDGDVDRNNEKLVLDFLKSKYSLNNLVAAPLQEYSGTMKNQFRLITVRYNSKIS